MFAQKHFIWDLNSKAPRPLPPIRKENVFCVLFARHRSWQCQQGPLVEGLLRNKFDTEMVALTSRLLPWSGAMNEPVVELAWHGQFQTASGGVAAFTFQPSRPFLIRLQCSHPAHNGKTAGAITQCMSRIHLLWFHPCSRRPG